ncbi:hypothetical protein COLO4_13512 [Corchorus olitorius]|uniref:AP2/ERF domain-containing protein n=1 Tax=Corchorus olitorius TaxID=93759 RepID=A0A1R3JW87_9ROSI|nr:hypothetical protein COLO4_13512 [Corchorus olitorius]
MEEEMLSGFSSSEVNNATSNDQFSDSISTTHHTANKRKRFGSNGGGSASRFKGVMRQKNGQWGAQLYANHDRIWLGTFKSETDAAMAYDSAAIKFRSADTHRNFPWTEITLQEPKFQSLHSPKAVLAMIRDGSYQYKFMDFLKVQSKTEKVELDFNSVGTYCNNGVTCKQLFQKELTPSDVGKLNRLVIPKKYALKYFPPIVGTENVHGEDGSRIPKDAELVFYDKGMRLWKFRYCYWHSSQSFVFTRGWNKFLKEKELKASDVISFFICESKKDEQVRRFCMIDVNKDGNDESLIQAANMQVGRETDLQLRLGNGFGFDGENVKDVNVKQVPELMELLPKQETAEVKPALDTKGFKLFGIQIA